MMQMRINTVIGLGFGDEGKGITTDYLCSQSTNPLVVRFSGGQQAGHTVVHNGIRHVFSNFGSGTLRGVSTYWSKFCTVDPIGIVNELTDLIKKGLDPFLMIDSKCPVTTPYDARYNQIVDESNGTCGVGVGSTIKREEDHYSLTFGDIYNPWILNNKLDSIKNYYVTLKLDLTRFMECIDIIKNDDTHIRCLYNIPTGYDYIYEGSQGLLLDKNIGFFPNVTRSNTGSKNILSIFGAPFIWLHVHIKPDMVRV